LPRKSHEIVGFWCQYPIILWCSFDIVRTNCILLIHVNPNHDRNLHAGI